MVKTRKMFKENAINNHKIRECSIKLTRLNVKNSVAYQKALFRMHGIRDCYVQLSRLTGKTLASTAPKKQFLCIPKVKSVRSYITWLPTIFHTTSVNMKTKTKPKSKEVSTLKLLPAKCQRSKSMDAQPKRQNSLTNDDLHSELLAKFNIPNRGLQPASRRTLHDATPEPLPIWKLIYEEFQNKVADRKKQNYGK